MSLGHSAMDMIFKTADAIIKAMEDLFAMLSQSLGELFGIPDELLPDVLEEMPLFAFLFGGGIIFILGYNLVSWFIDVLP